MYLYIMNNKSSNDFFKHIYMKNIINIKPNELTFNNYGKFIYPLVIEIIRNITPPKFLTRKERITSYCDKDIRLEYFIKLYI